MNSKSFLLWDLPTRLFHWLLVIAITGLIVSGLIGGNLIEWHGRIGVLTTGLIAFRLAWGFLGSTYARFGQFFPTPGKLIAYLRGTWQGEGHNPLGALSVFGLLGLITLQIATGLVSNDDIAFRGPLYELVGSDLSSQLSGLHRLLSNVLIALIVLHIAAIAFYGHVKKQKLVKPMIIGRQEGEGESARGGGVIAVIIALTIAGAAIYGATGSWLPEPPPPPAAAPTPAW